MADVARGSVLLTPRFDNLMSTIGRQLEGGFSAADSVASKSGSKAATSFGAGLSAKAGAIMGVVSAVTSKAAEAIAGSLDSAVSRVDTLNNFPKVMQSLGYSGEEADASIKGLSDRLSTLPTRLDDMATNVQMLAPSSKSLTQATDRALAFNDALLAGGTSADTQKNAMDQLVKGISIGKFEMDGWQSIQAAMPGQLDQVAKSMLGQEASAMDLYYAIQQGQVSMSDFADEVVRMDTEGGEGFKSFYDQAQDATGGIRTSVSNMQNAVTKGIAKVIDSIGSENVVAPVNAMKKAINDAFGGIADAISGFKEYAGDVWTALEDNGMAQWLTDSLGAVAGAIGEAAGAAKGLVEGLVPPPEAVAEGLGRLRDACQWMMDHKDAIMTAGAVIAGGFAAIKVAQGVTDGVRTLGDLKAAFELASGAMQGANLAGKLQAVADGISLLGDGSKLSGIGGIAGKVSQIATAATNAGGGITGLSTALGLGPWGLVAAAVAAVVAGLIWFFTQTELGQQVWSDFTSFLGECWTSISEGVSAFAGEVGKFFTETIPAKFGELVTAVGTFVEGIGLFFTETIPQKGAELVGWFAGLPAAIGGWLSSALSTVGSWASGMGAAAVKAGGDFLSGVVDFVTQLPGRIAHFAGLAVGLALDFAVSLALAAVKAGSQFLSNVSSFVQQLPGKFAAWFADMVNKALTWAGNMAAKAQEAGGKFLSNVSTLVSQLPGKLWGWFTDMVNKAVTWAGNMAAKAQDAGKRFLSGVGDLVSQLPGKLAGWFADMVGKAAKLVGDMAAKAADAGGKFLSGVGDLVSQLPGKLAGWFADMVGKAAKLVGDMAGKAGDIGTGFLDGIKSGFEQAVKFVSGIPGEVLGFFSNMGSKLFESGKSLLDGFVNGIKSGFDKAVGAVEEGLDWIRGFFPFSPAKRGPFSGRGYTTYSGRALMEGLAGGIGAGASLAVAAAGDSLGRVRDELAAEALTFSAAAAPARYARRSLAAAPDAAAAGRAGRQVEQTFNFYSPVDEPDEVARKVRMAERYGIAAQV